jgi:hypothetical protein
MTGKRREDEASHYFRSFYCAV